MHTLWPCDAKAPAKFAVNVDLPTPPLKLYTAILLHLPLEFEEDSGREDDDEEEEDVFLGSTPDDKLLRDIKGGGSS